MSMKKNIFKKSYKINSYSLMVRIIRNARNFLIGTTSMDIYK